MPSPTPNIIFHQAITIGFCLSILAVILHILASLLYFREALKTHQSDLAFAIMLALTASIIVMIPDTNPWWNYLGIGWLALLIIFAGKDLFIDYKKDTLRQKLIVIFGILMIIAAVLIGLYVPLPDWVRDFL